MTKKDMLCAFGRSFGMPLFVKVSMHRNIALGEDIVAFCCARIDSRCVAFVSNRCDTCSRSMIKLCCRVFYVVLRNSYTSLPYKRGTSLVGARTTDNLRPQTSSTTEAEATHPPIGYGDLSALSQQSSPTLYHITLPSYATSVIPTIP